MTRLRKDLRTDHFSLAKRLVYKLIRPHLSDLAYANCELRRWLGGGDVKRPVTFNEKIMWLKYNYRPPGLANLADKVAVREFVAERIGEQYLNVVYGIFDDPRRMPIGEFPREFVMKATHGCDMTLIVEDKETVDWAAVTKVLDKWLQTDYSKVGREWIYGPIPHRLIVEKLLLENGAPPSDYKVFCFNGEPYCVQVDIDRFGNHKKAFFDREWTALPFTIMHPTFDGEVPVPSRLKEMLELSTILAKGLPFVRVDWYSLRSLVFGEMTFFPLNGTAPFYPSGWDLILGDKLVLPSRSL